MGNPKISVVMPVYNGEQFLKEAVESVLKQTFNNFEFIIVNDASTDNSLKVINGYTDKRIKLVSLEKKSGIAKALNYGISISAGKYIARMDSDDICLPDRLKLQAEYLDKNSEVGILGTNAYLIDAFGRNIGKSIKPSESYLLKWRAFAGFVIIHPAVMARTGIMQSYKYDENFQRSQDTELWSRLLFEAGVKFYNLQEYLLKLRIHNNSSSKIRTTKHNNLSSTIIIKNIKRYIFMSKKEEEAIKNMRNNSLCFRNVIVAIKLYWKLFACFCKREKLNLKKIKKLKKELIKSNINFIKILAGQYRRRIKNYKNMKISVL